jgi:hypothetical protein
MPFGIKDVELVERIRWLEVLVKKKDRPPGGLLKHYKARLYSIGSSGHSTFTSTSR